MDEIHLMHDPGENSDVPDIMDAEKLGRILAGARKREGYDRMGDFVLDMYRVTGHRWHENTLYIVERGERLPNLNMLLAYVLTLGMRFEELAPAFHADLREQYRKLIS